MGDVTLKVRVRAVDETGPTIEKIKRAAASVSEKAGGGLSRLGTFMQSPLGAGLAGGALGGGIVAIASAMQSMTTQLIDIAKKIWNILLESSGYMQASVKLWNTAILEVFRPMGDMVGMTLMPMLQTLMGTTADTYAEFLKNVRGGMDLNTAMQLAMDENTKALSTFLAGLAPVISEAVTAITPALATMVEKLTPVIVGAIGTAAPQIGQAFMNGISASIAESTGLSSVEDYTNWMNFNQDVMSQTSTGDKTKAAIETFWQFGLKQLLDYLTQTPGSITGPNGYTPPGQQPSTTPANSSNVFVYGNVYANDDLMALFAQQRYSQMTDVRVS